MELLIHTQGMHRHVCTGLNTHLQTQALTPAHVCFHAWSHVNNMRNQIGVVILSCFCVELQGREAENANIIIKTLNKCNRVYNFIHIIRCYRSLERLSQPVFHSIADGLTCKWAEGWWVVVVLTLLVGTLTPGVHHQVFTKKVQRKSCLIRRW